MAEAISITPNSLHTTNDGKGGHLVGFWVFEDASSTAYITFRNGSASGTIVHGLHFSADQEYNVWLSKDEAHEFPDGVYVVEESGSVTGTLRIA